MKIDLIPNSKLIEPITEIGGYVIPKTYLGMVVANELAESDERLKIVDMAFYLEVKGRYTKKELNN